MEVGESLGRRVEIVVEWVECVVDITAWRQRGRAFEIAARFLPEVAARGPELALALGAQSCEAVKATIDPASERVELPADCLIASLGVLFTEVVGLRQQVPDVLDQLRLVYRLVAKLLQGANRPSERRQSRAREGNEGKQHRRQRHHQELGKRRPPCRPLLATETRHRQSIVALAGPASVCFRGSRSSFCRMGKRLRTWFSQN